MFATPSEELHRMWIAAISHIVEPNDWHSGGRQHGRGSGGGDHVALHASGSGGGNGNAGGRKKRRSLNPFERKQRVLARFRNAVHQVLKSLHTGRSIVGRTST